MAAKDAIHQNQNINHKSQQWISPQEECTPWTTTRGESRCDDAANGSTYSNHEFYWAKVIWHMGCGLAKITKHSQSNYIRHIHATNNSASSCKSSKIQDKFWEIAELIGSSGCKVSQVLERWSFKITRRNPPIAATNTCKVYPRLHNGKCKT